MAEKKKAAAKKSNTAEKPAKVKTGKTESTKVSKSFRGKGSRKKTNLLKMYSEMNKMTLDAVDREIMRRFKIIIDTCDEDITKTSLGIILKEPKSVELSSYHESLQPYIKHYLFMLKRTKNAK